MAKFKTAFLFLFRMKRAELTQTDLDKMDNFIADWVSNGWEIVSCTFNGFGILCVFKLVAAGK